MPQTAVRPLSVSKGLLRISMLYMPRFSLVLVMLDDARRVMMVMVCRYVSNFEHEETATD